MTKRSKTIMWTGGLAMGLVAAAPAVGAWRSHRAAANLTQQLDVGPPSNPRAVFTSASLAGLPDPVARYFRHVLGEGQPDITRVELIQEGDFAPDASGWRPMYARQLFSTDPVGFVWEARIQVAPLVPVYVRDAYLRGNASMRAELVGLYPLVNAAGARELNSGALQRYLAEAVWFPTALLPGKGVTWRAVDDSTAVASLTDSGTTVSLEFRFNNAGDVREMYTPGRFREVNGRYETAPWAVQCHAYEAHEGVRIPTDCAVEWRLPEGPLPYWRGHITDIRYDFER